MNGPSRLILFSGGIDSAYLLKYSLVETNDVVIAHHVHLINREGRHEAEAKACRDIVSYCTRHYRPFHYTESTVERTAFRAPGYDVITVAAEGGIAASNYLFNTGEMPDFWMMGFNQEEFDEVGDEDTDITKSHQKNHSEQSVNRMSHVLAAMAATCYPNDPPNFKQHEIKPKKEFMNYLGDELCRLCWTCRTPIKDNNSFKECSKCKTCKLMVTIRVLSDEL